MINHKHKFIFIHIPKTGGTSIEKLFDSNADKKDVAMKHAKLSDFADSSPDWSKFKNYFYFSFVRNPWDLTVSMYKYLWTSSYAWPTKWRVKHKKFSKLTFSNWVNHDFFQSPTIKSSDVASNGGIGKLQSNWLQSKNKLKPDFIGKFENLQEDFNIVCDKIGIPRQKLPHTNKTKRKHYTEYYNNETKQIVAEKFAKDIELFGYKFGE